MSKLSARSLEAASLSARSADDAGGALSSARVTNQGSDAANQKDSNFVIGGGGDGDGDDKKTERKGNRDGTVPSVPALALGMVAAPAQKQKKVGLPYDGKKICKTFFLEEGATRFGVERCLCCVCHVAGPIKVEAASAES